MDDSKAALSHINTTNIPPLKSELADGFNFSAKKRPLRAAQPRASVQMPKAKQNDHTKSRKSRKRSRSPELVQTKPERKRIKLKEKKDPFGAKKRAIESLQAKFLMHHRTHFQPLLPPNSKFFDKLMSEYSPDQRISPRIELEDQPSLMKSGFMKDYQLQGLSFLLWMHNNGMNCILGDEMGLGKTLQTLSLFAYLKETEGYSFPNLIICPLSVLSSWINECNKWFPSFGIVKIHGPAAERAHQKDLLRNKVTDIVVTTYDAYVVEDSWFKSKHWSYCVLDEGHKIKDWKTLIARKVQGLGSLHRLILTGTPIQNNLAELWSLLHWLYPTVFVESTQRIFKDAFDLSSGTYEGPFLDSVKKVLRLIMLRRTKQLVEHSVPPLDEMVVFLPLTEAQRFWYLRLLRRLDTLTLNDIFQCKIEEDDDGRKEVANLVQKALSEGKQGTQAYKQLMNLLMQLRRLCDHPYMIKGSFPEDYRYGEHIVASSSKLQFIDKLLRDLIPKKERILCFSQWTGMLDMLEDYMALREIPYARLDGSVPRARRTLDIKLFQQEESPYQVFLISTQAGGLGINLTKATHVILCDSTWNPQIDRQAIARSHRIGQTKDVKVYRLICQDSVEDQMLDRLRKKLFLSCKVMTETSNNADSDQDGMGVRELLNILRRGTSAVARWEADSSDRGLSAFLSASLEEILTRSKQTEKLRDNKLKHEAGEMTDNGNMVEELEREEQELLSNVTVVRTRFFEGQWHRKDEKALNQEWSDIQKRNRSERLVMYNGIPSLVDELPYAASKVRIGPKADSKKAWEHENTCLDCWDGGDLICCDGCPRVYHKDCRGINAVSNFKGRLLCSQHQCMACERNASATGGMLFRCRTCPATYCEDCMPEGDIAAVGPTLPELLSLGYGEVSQAYWIYCEFCRTDRDSKQWQQDWEERLAMN